MNPDVCNSSVPGEQERSEAKDKAEMEAELPGGSSQCALMKEGLHNVKAPHEQHGSVQMFIMKLRY